MDRHHSLEYKTHLLTVEKTLAQILILSYDTDISHLYALLDCIQEALGKARQISRQLTRFSQ